MVVESTPPLYLVAQSVARAWFDLMHPREVQGLENLPRHGAFLLAANHLSHYDPPLIGCDLPRPLAYFARQSLLAHPVGAWLLPRLGTIPVDRDGPGDVKAIRRVLAALGEGRGLLVFPEGTRSRTGQMQPPKSGIGFLACRAGVPVVPVRVRGTFEAFGRGSVPTPGKPISITLGRPLQPEHYDPGKRHEDRYGEAATRIMAAIAALPAPPAAGA